MSDQDDLNEAIDLNAPDHEDDLPPRARDTYLTHIRSLIKEHGWAIQAVFGDSPEEGFSYTVGLTEAGLPELWLGTLAPQQAGGLLNATAQHVLPLDRLVDGSVLDVGYSVPMRLRGPVSHEEAEVGVANALYPHPRIVQVFQVLWPDTAGRYPGEPGYDEAGFPQRLLSRLGEDVG